ncbi:hypothetical protein E1B28_005586 [Marasmius oreades]|uniref:Uncharacterized protein n=1 Tax=Marasmius oreades TaxID=181124 RepID=A0A9P7S3V3_9AGAR|nr:uncharacterized protein E1B28_005586 [Marasmius oreades]KAG7094770.1 hypothetical protein E1B28_005586 [Marasmius oreades]
MSSQYRLTILISDDTFPALKKAGYRLCIAKEVNGKYDVAFQTVKEVAYQNDFEFEERFRIFGTRKFEVGENAQPFTRRVPILSGREVTLDVDGAFSVVSGPVVPSKPFTVHNQYAYPLHFGVDAVVDNDYNTAFVHEMAVLSGEIFVAPKKKLLIWFEQGLETGMMFTHTVSNSIRLDFTETNDITISYTAPRSAPEKGIWSFGPLPVLGQTYHPETNTFSLTPAILPSGDELKQLGELLRLEPPTHSKRPLAITAA